VWPGSGQCRERVDGERQAELARARRKGLGIAEAGEAGRDRLLREADADIRADAGRLSAGQRDQRELVGRAAQIRFWT
jgi:hypothetical protein